jgi:hypothetical protein
MVAKEHIQRTRSFNDPVFESEHRLQLEGAKDEFTPTNEFTPTSDSPF